MTCSKNAWVPVKSSIASFAIAVSVFMCLCCNWRPFIPMLFKFVA